MAKIGIVTVSDTRTSETDMSGPEVEAALRVLGFADFEYRYSPDEVESIREAILALSDVCVAVFTTGGTGFSPRDVTPEATSSVLDRRADNLSELMRLRGLDHTPYSHLSRGVCGVVGSALVINLPGSPQGARQGVEAIRHLLDPILKSLGGEGCPIPPDFA